MKTRNKRILHVITLSSVGGAQSVVVNLANAQCEYNDVYVLSSSSGEAWRALDSRVHVIAIKELKREISTKDIIVFLKLVYWRYKIQPDIIQLHSSKMGMLGRIVYPKRKTIYTVHGFDSMRVANRKFLFVEKLLKSSCRYIVGVSAYDVNNLKIEGIKKNVKLIYNGVQDCSQESFPDHLILQSQLLESLSVKYKNVIVSIARDDAPKRIDIFLELAKEFPNYAFVWIGNMKDYPKTDNVLLLGQVPMGYLLLNKCDLFTLCSDYEGLPMSIIEALSFSKPIVSSKVGGVTEILDGSNGFAVENYVDDFKKAIVTILSEPDRYSGFSDAARITFDKKFTLDRMVEGYDKLYYTIATE